MGESAGIIGKNAKRARVSTQLLFDVPLLVIIIILLIYGLLMLYSASWSYSLQYFDSGTYILFRQMRWVLAGLFAMGILSLDNYH